MTHLQLTVIFSEGTKQYNLVRTHAAVYIVMTVGRVA